MLNFFGARYNNGNQVQGGGEARPPAFNGIRNRGVAPTLLVKFDLWQSILTLVTSGSCIYHY